MNKNCAKCNIDYQLYVLQKCGHVFCEKCLYEHVNASEGYKINCLSVNCNQILRDTEIRKFLPTNRIEEYEMSQLPIGIIRKCLSKNCPFIYISENDVIFQCDYCEQPNCTKCKMRHNLKECVNNQNHEETREKSAQEVISQKKRIEIEAYDLKSDLVTNSDGFNCLICDNFFLPNTQVMLRTCHHEVCFECLQQLNLNPIKSFKQLVCPICGIKLTSVEITKLLGLEFVISINKNLIRKKLYSCKYPNCEGFWDYNPQTIEELECFLCGNMNCIPCDTVHKGESCMEYQKSREYIDHKLLLENLKARKSVICLCGNMLIHSGCGSDYLYCDNCSEVMCVLTGKLAGLSLPEGCGCTVYTPCHYKCLYGCFYSSI